MATYFNSISSNFSQNLAPFEMYSSFDSSGNSAVGITFGQVNGYSPTATQSPAVDPADPNTDFILTTLTGEGVWTVVLEIDFTNFGIGSSNSSQNSSQNSNQDSGNGLPQIPINSGIKISASQASSSESEPVNNKGTGNKYIVLGKVKVKKVANSNSGAILYSYKFNQYWTGNIFLDQAVYVFGGGTSSSGSASFFADSGSIAVNSADRRGLNYNTTQGQLNVFDQKGNYVILDQKGELDISKDGQSLALIPPPDGTAGWQKLTVCNGTSTKSMWVFGTTPK